MTTWGQSGSSQWKGRARAIASVGAADLEQAIPEAPKSKKRFPNYKGWFQKTGPFLVPENRWKRNETNGWVSFRFPLFSGTKSVPKTGTKILKKNLFFYTILKKNKILVEHELIDTG